MTTHTAEIIAGFGALGAALVAAFSATMIWRQTRLTRLIAESELILRTDQRMQEFDRIHLALRPGSEVQPTAEDWPLIDGYLGLFERINVMHDKKLLDLSDICAFYGSRLNNLLNHPTLVSEKLAVDGGESWRNFESLVGKLSLKMPAAASLAGAQE